MQKLHLSRRGWQGRLIGLWSNRHCGLLYGNQIQVDFSPTVVNGFLNRIGNKDQLIVDRYRGTQQDTGIRLYV